MPVLSAWKRILGRAPKIRIRNSIAVPIVLFLLSISLVVLLTGYYVNKSVFYSVFEERESNKARNIHLTIESIVDTEIKRISSIAKILKNDTDIMYGLLHYTGTRGDSKPLKTAMEQLYPKMHLPLFAMADPRGKILYRAGMGRKIPKASLRELPAFRRALKERKQVVSASDGPGGWGIWAAVPVHEFGGGKPSGMLVFGRWIDDDFASKIARETGSQVFLADADRVIAGSRADAGQSAFDPSLAGSALAGGKAIFRVDRERYRSYTYVPLQIVDETFCLVIETDISVIEDLLVKNRDRMAKWGIVLLSGIAMVGMALTLTLVWPLNRLYGKALQAIREYSGTEAESESGGNEITTLVRATDVMLEAIRNHLAERIRAEDALRETSTTLEALIHASPLAVVVSDASGVVRVWNPAASRLFGRPEEEVVGRPNPLLAEEENPELCATCRLVLRGERFSNREIRGLRADGAEIVLAFSGAPLRDAGGRIAMMAIIADVTEAKRAEAALRRSEDQLRQSQKMEAVGRLAGGAAHDFNNLLSVINGYTELLLGKLGCRSPIRRDLEEIHRAGERAAALTRQLLAFSRRQVLQPKILRLPEAVENIRNMIGRLIGEDIEIVAESASDAWTIRADPSQIEQILMNLAVNARDAMPGGGRIAISVENLDLPTPLGEGETAIPPGRYAVLLVTDNGCGMDDATLSRIFEPFFTTKEPGKGTGLGLATVYGIVKQSNGYIRVRSAPGTGTSFAVYLPAADGEEIAEEKASEIPRIEESAGRETILLVEDEDMVRDLAAEILQRFGYTVLEASDGESALSVSEAHREDIDLLITDLVMPGMSGIELAGKFRESRPGVPVLFMSGYFGDAAESPGDATDRRSFLQKPITPSNLSRKIREVLGSPAPA